MNTSLSFKQYLDSKSKLYAALERDPIHEAQYEVYRYCRIVVGESKEEKQYINLKPKQVINVKWKYHDLDGIPDPISIEIPHLVESTDFDHMHKTFQTGERLIKWLRNNAREKS